jgi:hypothetical protein
MPYPRWFIWKPKMGVFAARDSSSSTCVPIVERPDESLR